MLVAGVTGGKSLIESARIRAFINELNGWKQAVYTFRTARDRYPGDRDNLGKFGNQSGYTYTKTDFSEPFASGSFVPDAISAPYAELYTEGISDFKPTGNEDDNGILGKGFPKMNSIKDIFCQYYYHTSGNTNKNYYFSDIKAGDITLRCPYKSFSSSNGTNPKVNKQIDEKMDDGIHSSGIIRSMCYGTGAAGGTGYITYDETIDSKNKCGIIHFDLRLK